MLQLKDEVSSLKVALKARDDQLAAAAAASTATKRDLEESRQQVSLVPECFNPAA